MYQNIRPEFKAISISGARIPKRASLDYSDEAIQLSLEVDSCGICDSYKSKMARKMMLGIYSHEEALKGYYSRVVNYIRMVYGPYSKVYDMNMKYTVAVIIAESFEGEMKEKGVL